MLSELFETPKEINKRKHQIMKKIFAVLIIDLLIMVHIPLHSTFTVNAI